LISATQELLSAFLFFAQTIQRQGDMIPADTLYVKELKNFFKKSIKTVIHIVLNFSAVTIFTGSFEPTT
jgi:hypothetical protein